MILGRSQYRYEGLTQRSLLYELISLTFRISRRDSEIREAKIAPRILETIRRRLKLCFARTQSGADDQIFRRTSQAPSLVCDIDTDINLSNEKTNAQGSGANLVNKN